MNDGIDDLWLDYVEVFLNDRSLLLESSLGSVILILNIRCLVSPVGLEVALVNGLLFHVKLFLLEDASLLFKELLSGILVKQERLKEV